MAAERKLLTIPADASEGTKLARHYANALFGEIAVSTSNPSTIFDFRRVGERDGQPQEPDGTISFITIAPGVSGVEFVVGSGPKQILDHPGRATRIHLRRALKQNMTVKQHRSLQDLVCESRPETGKEILNECNAA